MLNRFKYPLKGVLLALPAFFSGLSFWIFISFIAADSTADLKSAGKSVDVSWEAAVLNHGDYYAWYSANQHFIWFLFSFALFLISNTSWMITNSTVQEDKLNGKPTTSYYIAMFIFLHLSWVSFSFLIP